MTVLRSPSLWLALLVASASVAADPRPHTVQDLAYGEALYDFYRHDYFAAITRIDVALQEDRLPHHRDEAELLKGGLLFAYGVYDEAERIFDRLLSRDADPAIRNQVWFHLAGIRHRQGDAVKAMEALDNLRDAELPGDLQDESRALRGRVLMDLGDYEAAVKLLMTPSHGDRWDGYARFNLGVALIRTGDAAEGRAYLSVLGERQAQDEESLALRDKANLALGYMSLREQRTDVAAEYLRKVSVNGIAADPGLLGLGWAEAANGHLAKALAAWDRLSRNDVSDSAVQESLLALPYLMIEFGDYRQAETRYQAAIDAFAGARERLTELYRTVGDGGLIERLLGGIDTGNGQDWRPPAMPDAFRGKAWETLFSGNEFQTVLRDARDLKFLSDRLSEWHANMGAYKDMVTLRRKGYEQRLPSVLDRLQHLDMTQALHERDTYAERLQKAAEGTTALPTGDELGMATRIAKIQAMLDRHRDSDALAAEHDKLRLLQGVYRWRLAVDHPARVWAVRKQVKALDEALADTDIRRRSLDDARKRALLGFDGYDGRIARLETTIAALRVRVAGALERHETYLRTLILRDLDRQSANLRSYEAQARFGLARTYDLAAARDLPKERGEESP